MNVPGVGGSAAQAVAISKDKTIGQADFLSLLVQQMRNQDPTQPMDSAPSGSQLAQAMRLEAPEFLA